MKRSSRTNRLFASCLRTVVRRRLQREISTEQASQLSGYNTLQDALAGLHLKLEIFPRSDQWEIAVAEARIEAVGGKHVSAGIGDVRDGYYGGRKATDPIKIQYDLGQLADDFDALASEYEAFMCDVQGLRSDQIRRVKALGLPTDTEAAALKEIDLVFLQVLGS